MTRIDKNWIDEKLAGLKNRFNEWEKSLHDLPVDINDPGVRGKLDAIVEFLHYLDTIPPDSAQLVNSCPEIHYYLFAKSNFDANEALRLFMTYQKGVHDKFNQIEDMIAIVPDEDARSQLYTALYEAREQVLDRFDSNRWLDGTKSGISTPDLT